jgi:hypothetical protein
MKMDIFETDGKRWKWKRPKPSKIPFFTRSQGLFYGANGGGWIAMYNDGW